jgi:O-antigen ligase
VAAGVLAVVVAASLLIVAPGAEAAFDAPKRVLALLGIAVAAIAIWVVPAPRRELPPVARWLRWLVVVALVGAVVAALASPRRAMAVDTVRVLLVGALCLPLGASRALDDGRWRLPLLAFLAGCVIDAVMSLLQAAGLAQPFALEAVAGRAPTGAMLGNEGQLALVLALAVIAAVGIASVGRRPAVRVSSAVIVVVALAALLVNRNLTALLAVTVGLGVLALVLGGRRALLPLAAGLVVFAGVMAVVPPLHDRVARVVEDARAGRWDDLTSNRLGAWAAALEMVRARPLTGVGPGTFGADFVPYRIAAELRWRTRFVIPVVTSTFSETHSDYLQALAELGVPAGLAAVIAAAVLLVALARRAGPASPEAAVLLALLCGGAVAALTWFPLQRPASAVPLLLAAGRAWRLLA